MANDDWRITVTFEDEGLLHRLGEHLRETKLASEVSQRLGDRVVASVDGLTMFVYTDTEQSANQAQAAIVELLPAKQLKATTQVHRWHPIEDRWEEPGAALPQTPEEMAAEHERHEADEAEASAASGFAEWEVRVELPSHRETVAFADLLQADGIDAVRRWKFLLVGAATEDGANALAQRISAEAPAGAVVHAQASGAAVWQTGGGDRFSILGGLGG